MKVNVKHILILLIVLSFLAAYYIPGGKGDVIDGNSIGFLGILFGIIVGFFIADLYSRYQGIRENSAIDSSSLSEFYFMASIIGENAKNKKWLKDIERKINNYIKKFMPLPWDKYSETEKEFGEIGKSLKELKYTSDKDGDTYSNLLQLHAHHSDAREKLVSYGKDKLSWGEWLVILFLGSLLLWSLFYIKEPSIVSIIFTGAVTSAILLLLFVIKDLNNLNFGESSISIEPYERVLDAIGKPRYFKRKESFWKNLFILKTRSV